MEEKLKSAKGKNRHIGAERKARFPEAEESLKTWVLEFRMDGIAVTLNMTLAEIPKEMIVKSFKKCGISNAMDGSEDDLFGQDENGEEIDENEREIVGKL
ncbi:19739_t:CDS:2 [Rhizophagus irregularis]|nr:19739_t:CDS:2 [Rhizophagus irregularis]